MRRDMAKVIVERPRRGGYLDYGERLSHYERHTRDRSDPDVLPMRMPMGYARTKHLNENLAPLFRYLQRNVGRPWDAVHSEIRAHLRVTNPIQLHVMEHVEQFVYFARREGDRVVLTSRHGYLPLVLEGDALRARYVPRRGVYVCCDTGLLRAFPTKRRPRRGRCEADGPG